MFMDWKAKRILLKCYLSPNFPVDFIHSIQNSNSFIWGEIDKLVLKFTWKF